jgi:hypothetical protein
LVDWEDAEEVAGPFADVFHYVVQAHVLLGRPSREAVLHGIRGDGAVGRSLRAYAAAADVPLSAAAPAFRDYLVWSQARLNPTKRHWRRGLEARTRLLELVEEA